MPPVAAGAVALAFVLDRVAGEFPARIHPVALFGRVVEPFDRSFGRPRAVGAAVALGLPLAAGGLAGGLVAVAAGLHPVAAAVAAGLVLFAATSLRMLRSIAREVIDRSASDLAGARTAARSLVGRDVESLSPAEVRSAAVESAAENLVDGLVAPLFAFAIGAQVSPAVAAGAAAWVKAVNTLDSMLGYEGTPIGWGSARLDDAVMWLPARLGAGLIALAALDPGAAVRARPWAREPASPNSGWPMATLAAVLGVRLAKPGAYTLARGDSLPTVEEARRGGRIVGRAGWLSVALAGVVAWS